MTSIASTGSNAYSPLQRLQAELQSEVSAGTVSSSDESALSLRDLPGLVNRFQVVKGSEEAFERMWQNRDSYLNEMAGFVEFHLLKGPEAEDHTLYSSHTVWESQDDFTAWTQSENFRAAHRNAGSNKPLYIGHPVFEGFTSVDGA